MRRLPLIVALLLLAVGYLQIYIVRAAFFELPQLPHLTCTLSSTEKRIEPHLTELTYAISYTSNYTSDLPVEFTFQSRSDDSVIENKSGEINIEQGTHPLIIEGKESITTQIDPTKKPTIRTTASVAHFICSDPATVRAAAILPLTTQLINPMYVSPSRKTKIIIGLLLAVAAIGLLHLFNRNLLDGHR